MTPVHSEPRVSSEVVRDHRDLAALRSGWDDLYAAGPHEPSASYEWTAGLLRHHVGETDVFRLVRLREGQRTTGLVPLVAKPVTVLGQRVTMLTPVAERYNTHSDLLVSNFTDASADAWLEALAGLDVPWDCFRMSKLLEDSSIAGCLERRARGNGWLCHARYGRPAYTMALPDSYEAYLSTRSAKFRNHLKRTERKLEQAGALHEWALADGRGGQVDRAYEAVLSIERHSWKHDHGTAITAVGHQSGFYRDLCVGAHAAGRLHLQILELDERPIAYNLGYIRDRCYWYLKTSYVADARPLGPATVLRARLIARLIALGVRWFDFPGEPYEWERQWADSVRWHRVLSVYNGTLKGRLLCALDRLRHPDGKPEWTFVDPRALKGPAA